MRWTYGLECRHACVPITAEAPFPLGMMCMMLDVVKDFSSAFGWATPTLRLFRLQFCKDCKQSNGYSFANTVNNPTATVL